MSVVRGNPLKKELRKKIAQKLAEVTQEDITEQSRIVTEQVTSASWFHDATRISVFVNTAGEIETDAIILACLKNAKQLFIPQFTKGDKKMKQLRVPSAEHLKTLDSALWGIRQPAPGCGWEEYEEGGPLDVVLMPGVAFTEKGERLGHGMGYYDRMLAAHQSRFGQLPLRVGLSLKQQIVDAVPLDATDVPLNHVIHA